MIEMSPAGENSQPNGDSRLGDSSSTGDQTMQAQSSLVGECVNACSGDGPEEVGKSLPPNPLLYHQATTNNRSISGHNKKAKLSRSTTTSSSSAKADSRKASEQSLKRSSDSDNIVTASMTRNSSSSSDWQDANHTTTSSGSGGDEDDRRSSMKVEKAIEASTRVSGETMANKETNEHTNGDISPPRKKARHHLSPQDPHPSTAWTYKSGVKSPSLKDDGSSLQVPGDDGSDRIVAGDVAGGVPIKPATVVASRLFTPSVASTGTDRSVSSSEHLGSKQKSSSKTSDLLPPHREPRYHTIRDTLYRLNVNERTEKIKKHPNHCHNRSKSRRRGTEKKSSKTKDKADPSSTEEVIKDTIATNTSILKHHHHRGSRSSGSNSSASAQKLKAERAKKKPRSTGNSDVTSNANADSVKSKSSNLTSPESSLMQESNTGGSSSGSGTEGTEDGYAGSISSNENGSGNQQLGSSSPCPSETSSEEYEQQEGRRKVRLHRRNGNSKQKSSGEDQESSEIADFGSSGSSETMDEEDGGNIRRQDNSKAYGRSTSFSSSSSSPSLSFSNFSESDGLELAYLSAKRDADAEHERKLKLITRKKKSKQAALNGSITKSLSIKPSKRMTSKRFKDGRPPILAMGCDVMAHILTFLQPPDILNVLTMPLSKGWRRNFTSQPELWRVLCLVEPFKATVDDDSISPSRDSDEEAASSSDDSYCRLKSEKNTDKSLDKYRLLYTSFVRCMKYVAQIREDAINGRPPAYIDYGISGAFSDAPGMQYIANTIKGKNDRSSSPPPPTALGSNRSLQLFLAQANEVMNSSNNDDNLGGETKTDDTPSGLTIFPTLSTAARVGTGHNKVRKNLENGLALFAVREPTSNNFLLSFTSHNSMNVKQK